MKDKKSDMARLNIRLHPKVRDWYKEQGIKYSVPYTNYISLLLTQFYENEQSKALLEEFNKSLKFLKETSGDVTTEQVLSDMKEMMSLFKENGAGSTMNI